MDFNFHYCTVKVLAVTAGFPEDEAQLFASYSQFVDDFDTYKNLIFLEVPDYAMYLAKKNILLPGYSFTPVTTGFNSLVLDYPRLLDEEHQRQITVPFHFIPFKSLNHPVDTRAEYRTQEAVIGDGSLISTLMLEAKAKYLQNDRLLENKIRIGLLLHIFADTYAHQYFSGFKGWENIAKLTLCKKNADDLDILSTQKPLVDFHLGHSDAFHAPDLTGVRFDMELKFSEHTTEVFDYSRSNTNKFCTAARNILNYFHTLLDKEPVSDEAWHNIQQKLVLGFYSNINVSEANSLAHWKMYFPDIQFHYNKNDMYYEFFSVSSDTCNQLNKSEKEIIDMIIENPVENSYEADKVLLNGVFSEGGPFMQIPPKNDAFFRYSVIADTVRTFVNTGNLNWIL